MYMNYAKFHAICLWISIESSNFACFILRKLLIINGKNR